MIHPLQTCTNAFFDRLEALKPCTQAIAALVRRVVAAVVGFFQNLFTKAPPARQEMQLEEEPVFFEAEFDLEAPAIPDQRIRFSLNGMITEILVGTLETANADAIVTSQNEITDDVLHEMAPELPRPDLKEPGEVIVTKAPGLGGRIRFVAHTLGPALYQLDKEKSLRHITACMNHSLEELHMRNQANPPRTVAFSLIGLIAGCPFEAIIPRMMRAIQDYGIQHRGHFDKITIVVRKEEFERASLIAEKIKRPGSIIIRGGDD